MRESLLNELESREKKVEVAEKLEAYDKGISDVISAPVDTLFEYRNEVEECHEALKNLFDLWEEKRYSEMEMWFKKFGFSRKIEKNYTKDNA